MRSSSGGWVSNRPESFTSIPWPKNICDTSSAWRLAIRAPAEDAPIWSSAPAMPSGLRVNCTLEASARNSRWREAAEEYRHRALAVAAAALAAHDEFADRADEHDARQHADHADVEAHVAVQDMAELVRHDALQFIPVQR